MMAFVKGNKTLPVESIGSRLTYIPKIRPCGVKTKSCKDDIAALNRGSTRQEVLSGELQSGIADVADIDRSVELFTWLWSSMWGRSKPDQSPSSAPEGNPPTPHQGVTGEDWAVSQCVTGSLHASCIHTFHNNSVV